MTAIDATDLRCAAFAPIHWPHMDTASAILQIKQRNVVYQTLRSGLKHKNRSFAVQRNCANRRS